MRTKECRIFFCQDGQWQVGEFTATKECCLRNFNPKCEAMGFTSTGFISSTESPSTSSSIPLCDTGSMTVKDCRMFFCQDGQWQVGEFTATKECCLQEFHLKCTAMGFTSTDFISSTESPSTSASIPVCDTGSMTVKDCRMFFCQDGQWQVGEFTATKECCLQEFHPKCFISSTESPSTSASIPLCDTGSMTVKDCRMFFCQDGQWQVGEFTATKECCLQEFHPKCTIMGFTSTGFISSTESPSTSASIPLCDTGSMTVRDCRMFFCQDGQWQVGEFTATKECCLQEFHPKCTIMGFTSTGQTTGYTSTEHISTTESLRPTTSTIECDSASMQPQECRMFHCQDGQWQVGEFTATMECCLKEFHPKCEEMGFTSTGGLIPTTILPTTPISACTDGESRQQYCIIHVCLSGEWQPFEFTPTQECCLKEFHPKCAKMGFTSPVSSSSTTSPNSGCSTYSSRVEDCGVYLCENGQWQLFEFFSSDECCKKENHPKCAELGTTPLDDSLSKNWPLTDYDSIEELDILLIRLPLLHDLPFPVAYSNGGPFQSNEDRSPKKSNNAVHHRE
ncbi:hypothetical protein CHS0354_008834 [Potamilus streckersoni]|uniref:Uncharacterized protein n=1 Tax=Potamilus streckersoni TaxID=2493646 RepID=A0AAE0SNV6_9BIVA|nr:hypothetical protein CHS0354_008834 [Potamilus streckersoni]